MTELLPTIVCSRGLLNVLWAAASDAPNTQSFGDYSTRNVICWDAGMCSRCSRAAAAANAASWDNLPTQPPPDVNPL